MNSNDLIERLDEHASYLQAFEEEGQTMIERQCIAAMSEASTLIQSQAAEIARLTGLALSPKGHPMTTQPTQDAIVTQRDREIAERFGSEWWLEPGIALDLSVTLATYRAEIEAATIERCAGVAEEIGESYGEDEAGWLDCTETVAINIRNLKGQTS